ncbi:hypothetical protein JCM16814_12400 [Desulfobaculum senezii]
MVDLDRFRQALELNIGVCQPDNARLLSLLSQVVPLRISRFASGLEHNGWVVPRQWSVDVAEIRRGGRLLFDGRVHPLAVAGYSSSFSGTLSRRELDAHVFCRKDVPDAYAFHSMYNYRPWQEHWGFCVPWTEYSGWPEDGEYEVRLETSFTDGDMLVGDLHLAGERPDTVAFNAHTCHPCQANDDLAGVFVLLELFSRLRERSTRWSYRLVLAPEHLGTVFYTATLPQEELELIRLGVFAEMLGSSGPLALQRSFYGDSLVDRVAAHILAEVQPGFTDGAFRTIVGNDETVWEAPGIEVPMISLSRWPYPEYHTSHDDMRIMHPGKLEQAVEVLEAMVDVLETDSVVHRRFNGLVALSNPRYDLYVERPDPVVEKNLTERDIRFGQMQDRLPRAFDGARTVFDIAEAFGVSYMRLREYLQRFEDKDLVALTPPEHLHRRPRPLGP